MEKGFVSPLTDELAVLSGERTILVIKYHEANLRCGIAEEYV